MKDTIKLLKATNVLDMFTIMIKRDITLTAVKHMSKRICRGLQENKQNISCCVSIISGK